MSDPPQVSVPNGSAVRRRRTPEPYASVLREAKHSHADGPPEHSAALAYLAMLACAGYAPVELVRLIVRHHDTYDQLTLVPTFALELVILSWGMLGILVAVAHAWLWVFGVTELGVGRRPKPQARRRARSSAERRQTLEVPR